MPVKLPRSPYYSCRRWNLIGYGDTGYITSRSKKKNVAQAMERLLDEIGERALLEPGWYELLDAVCKTRTITLSDLMRAKREGTLTQLRKTLRDPLLTDATAHLLQGKHNRATITGTDQLLQIAPDGARLSWLTDGRRITRICQDFERAGKGRQRNSVRRYLLRAISLLLKDQLGQAERNRIFVDVDFPAEDDTREVYLSPAEIVRLISAAEKVASHEFAVAVRLMLQTGADRGMVFKGKTAKSVKRSMPGLRKQDVQIFSENGRVSGEIYLRDTKNKHRRRTLPISDFMSRELLAICQHKAPEDQVFSWSYSQVDYLWKAARTEAKLGHVRIKDLRHQFAIYGEEAGIPQTVLMRGMGHSSEEMTRRYQQRRSVLSGAQVEALEQAMFLGAEELDVQVPTEDSKSRSPSPPAELPTESDSDEDRDQRLSA